jgi:hypothetical protein
LQKEAEIIVFNIRIKTAAGESSFEIENRNLSLILIDGAMNHRIVKDYTGIIDYIPGRIIVRYIENCCFSHTGSCQILKKRTSQTAAMQLKTYFNSLVLQSGRPYGTQHLILLVDTTGRSFLRN